MPTPTLPSMSGISDIKQLINYIAKFQKEIEWLLGNLDSLNVRELIANIVTIRSDLTSGYVRWDDTGLVVNNGLYDTLSINMDGFVTMAGALIQSRPGTYPMLVMDPTSNLLKAMQTADSYIEMSPFGSINNSPSLSFVYKSGGINKGALMWASPTGGFVINSVGTDNIQISAGGFLDLYGDLVRVQGWGTFWNRGKGVSLQTELDNIWFAIGNLSTPKT